jgi:fumarylacetoacetase
VVIFPRESQDRSWVDGADGSDFPLQSLPYGVFRRAGESPRIGAAIGPHVLDLSVLHEAGLFAGTSVPGENVFGRAALNDFLACRRRAWSEVRTRLVSLLAAKSVRAADGQVVAADARLRDDAGLRQAALHPRDKAELLMPVQIRAYVDFYSSREHATNVGKMFRDPNNPLLPNWLHIPIGYNGRASSVVVSGTPIRRPCGQTKADDAPAPTFGPTKLLDIELEMGFITGPGNALGERLSPQQAIETIFGFVLVNDWSARDIQRWEYQPLGPFLAKTFATSISPWVVPLDALVPFRVPSPAQEPAPLPYLQVPGDWGLDIDLEILLADSSMASPQRIAATNFRHMYWTIVQQLVHQASNGTNIEAGDLYASGTVSGPTPDSYGSLLELTWRGTKPITLSSGQARKFLADGDTVVLRGRAKAANFRVSFGECAGTILPAIES